MFSTWRVLKPVSGLGSKELWRLRLRSLYIYLYAVVVSEAFPCEEPPMRSLFCDVLF